MVIQPQIGVFLSMLFGMVTVYVLALSCKPTYDRWKKAYGGLRVDQAKRLNAWE
ncbi:MAG: hypothetical protein ABIU05_01765 [Nitrospirales bacterium]